MNIKKFVGCLCCMLILITGCVNKADLPNTESNSYKENVDYNRKTQSQRTEVYSAEKELAGFTVPEGFAVELVASEKDGIVNPIDMTFDDAGNLWTQTASMYPLDPAVDIGWNELLKLMDDPEAQRKDPRFKRILDLYEGTTKGDDAILVISDLYGNSSAKVSVWADGLAIPQSILPYKNGAYVAQGSELFFLSDEDGDGKADKRTRMFTGFGYTDTHTMAHLLVRGPGDWVHFSHGALNKGKVQSLMSDASIRLEYSKIARFSLDAKKIELVGAGLNNIWGFQLRGNGQWYGSEANDIGWSAIPLEMGTSLPGIGGERIRPYQPFLPQIHEFRVGGTGISSMAFSDDNSGAFPEEWKDVALLANPITNAINAVKVIRNSDGTVTGEHLDDFLTSTDDWFRPVNVEFGPDGCLYIADWYNKIVSHNEVARSHPDRDKSHGRIWRVRHVSQKKKEVPNFNEVETNSLVAHLKSPSLWAKRAAWHQITDRPYNETKGLASELIKLVSDVNLDETTRIHALWSLEGIHHYDEKIMTELLSSNSENLRREAVRSLTSFSLDPSQMAVALKKVSVDQNPMVRSQVLRTIDENGAANEAIVEILVAACQPPLEGNQMGGSYERNFERFLARKALERYPTELQAYLDSPKADQQVVTNLIWASQALPKQQREAVFPELWKRAKLTELDEPHFIIVASMLSNTAIYNLVKPVVEQTKNAVRHLDIALGNLGEVQSPELSKLLEKPVLALLKSDVEGEKKLGLNAAAKMGINNTREAIISIVKGNGNSDKVMEMSMTALEREAVKNTAVFEDIAMNEELTFNTKLMALRILSKANSASAIKKFEVLIPNMKEDQLKSVATALSSSKEGVVVLKQLYAQSLITDVAFDIPSADRMVKADKNDAVAKTIMAAVEKREEEKKQAFDATLKKFMAIAEKGTGEPKKGEELFQTCLMCHSVGDKGQNIAPALDGSGMRENEALLTAILDPDAAMETSYAVYRITKKDDSSVEGFLVKEEEKGTTIAYMGGTEVFVPNSEIKSKQFIRGRSFMLKGLIDHYDDNEIADLLSYIRTLK